jgi:hypothetical protein
MIEWKHYGIVCIICLAIISIICCGGEEEQLKDQNTTITGLFDYTEEYGGPFSATVKGYFSDTE